MADAVVDSLDLWQDGVFLGSLLSVLVACAVVVEVVDFVQLLLLEVHDSNGVLEGSFALLWVFLAKVLNDEQAVVDRDAAARKRTKGVRSCVLDHLL